MLGVLFFLFISFLILNLSIFDYYNFGASLPLIGGFTGVFIVFILFRKKIKKKYLWYALLGIYLFASLIDLGYLRTLITKKYNKTVQTPNNNIFNFCTQNTAWVGLFQEEFGQFLKNNNCDVLFLQEIWDYTEPVVYNKGMERNKVADYLKDIVLNYNHTQKWREFLIAGDIVVKNEYKSKWEGFYAVYADIQGKDMWLINVHIWTPLTKRRAQSLINGNLLDTDTQGLVNTWDLREKQINEFIRFLEGLPLDSYVLIAGDFNTLPSNVLIWNILPNKLGYYKFSKSFWAYPTFSRDIPVILIDHVFGRNLGVDDVDYIFNDFSDHALVKGKVWFY